jgi:hypothetical protein
MKFFTILYFILFFTWAVLPAQEMIVNGGFDDDSGWTVYDMGATDPTVCEFGFTGDTPAFGDGPCLYLQAGPTTYSNILIWQAVTLEGGKAYQLSGAFKDISLDGVQFFWGEFYMSLEEPVDSVDWTPPAGGNTDDYLSFNTWTGCGAGVDGTFQADACDGMGEDIYVVPDSIDVGEPVTVYVGLKIGTGWGTGPTEFEVLIDEISVIDLNPNGTGETVAANPQIANEFKLLPNYPNPFNPSTNISFNLPVNAAVDVSIFDIQGRKITTIANRNFSAGTHEVHWNGEDAYGQSVPSGIYFCRLNSGNFQATEKMMLLR